MAITNEESVLNRYLLGRLTPEDREAVEGRLFSDDALFWERLCLIEDELIDAYARGQLDAEAEADFERHFLCTADRRSRLELAQALRSYVERQAQTGREGFWQRLRSPVVAPAWTLAAAALLLLTVPAVAWRFAATRGAGVDVSASIASGLVRDAGSELPRVRLPKGCRLLRLELDPGAEAYGGYGATLHGVEGGEIWAQSRLAEARPGRGAALTLVLPCELLPVGDYYVRLHGLSPPASPVSLSRYDFRIRRD